MQNREQKLEAVLAKLIRVYGHLQNTEGYTSNFEGSDYEVGCWLEQRFFNPMKEAKDLMEDA